MLVEINNKTRSKINNQLIKKVVRKFTKVHKIKAKNLSIAIVSDQAIKRINKKYRRKNCVTDILSFSGETGFLGELIIDYSQIEKQAKKYGRATDDELIFILVHGLLHLIGYDDKTEAERMRMIKLAETFIKNLKKK